MKKRLFAILLAVVMIFSLAACNSSDSGSNSDSSAASGSGETVKIICGYGVGGTADIVARKFAVVANQVQSDYNFIVENMTGGDGFSSLTYYTDQDASTKELIVWQYGALLRHDLGKAYDTEIVDFDRAEIYPIGSIDDRTWILYGTPDMTLEDIIAKSKNGGIKMSGGNPLSDCHLVLGSLLAQEGGTVMVVPYDGGAAQKKGLTDGKVDVFVGSSQAAQDEVEAGTLVPLLAFSDQPFEGFNGPDGAISVPAVAGESKADALDPSKDYSGSILRGGGGIGTRTGADEAWIETMTQIMKDVWAELEFSDWISEILLNQFQSYGEDVQAEIEKNNANAIAAYEMLSGT